MYLPLTGHRTKSRFEEKMSINSVGPPTDPRLIQPLDAAAKATQEAQKVSTPEANKQEVVQPAEDKGNPEAGAAFYANSMNTQDFLVLRSQSQDEPFKGLDDAIARMKENMEDVGEAIEALSKMAKAADPDNLALQVLQKTLEAMDETSGDKGE